jgi:hypothetical protein
MVLTNDEPSLEVPFAYFPPSIPTAAFSHSHAQERSLPFHRVREVGEDVERITRRKQSCTSVIDEKLERPSGQLGLRQTIIVVGRIDATRRDLSATPCASYSQPSLLLPWMSAPAASTDQMKHTVSRPEAANSESANSTTQPDPSEGEAL